MKRSHRKVLNQLNQVLQEQKQQIGDDILNKHIILTNRKQLVDNSYQQQRDYFQQDIQDINVYSKINRTSQVSILQQQICKQYLKTFTDNRQEQEKKGDINSQKKTVQASKEKLLQQALKYVPEMGFSNDALSQGAQDLQISAAFSKILDRDQAQLFEYWFDIQRVKLKEQLKDQMTQLQENKISKGKFLREAVVKRLQSNESIIGHLAQALSQQFKPQNIPQLIRQRIQLADEIYYLANDRQMDFSWYTKRVGLALFYSYFEVYMLKDYSEKFQDTYQALDEKIDQIHSLTLNKVSLSIKSQFDQIGRNVQEAQKYRESKSHSQDQNIKEA